MFAVHDRELAQILDTLQPFLLYLSDIIVEVQRLQDSLVASLRSSILLGEVLEDITHTQTRAAYLVGIGRTNTLTGSTHLILSLLSLIGSIEHTVRRHNQVSLL